VTCCTQSGTQEKREKNKKMFNNQKEAQVKLTKGLLDMIVLELLDEQPIHGYQVISKIRKSFGVYLGPSTVYPLLGSLEKKGQVSSVWNMQGERPRKVYQLTSEGKELLNFAENSLNLIVKKIGVHNGAKSADETEQTSVAASCLLKKTKLCSAPSL
jgi:PadR family transcriptional regulator PadR